MPIDKLARQADGYLRPYLSFQSARSAFRAFLKALQLTASERVLLPSFIGWSAREGSGVFDPVNELGLSYRFYRMDGRLTIDLEHLRQSLSEGNIKVLVIIHYFGYVDPGYREAVALAREYGALVLEDEAHAMFTDLIGGISGRLGDAAIFSLHKMLPVVDGGLLVFNRGSRLAWNAVSPDREQTPPLWEYDMKAIAEKRRMNAKCLAALLEPYVDKMIPLRDGLVTGEVPQTYPVLIKGVSRDRLYDLMNSKGYGVVTLYHTLIDQISCEEHPQAHALARSILNLPVHQDADPDKMRLLADELVRTITAMQKGAA